MRLRATSGRPGLTLMEVMVSTMIFLMSLAAIGQLITMGSQRALDARLKQDGVRICERMLGEFATGAQTFSSQGFTDYDKDPAWKWSADCEQVTNQSPTLWKVTIKARREKQYGNPVEVVISQMMIDPNDRGSTLDPPPTTADQQSSSGSSSTTGGS